MTSELERRFHCDMMLGQIGSSGDEECDATGFLRMVGEHSGAEAARL